MWLKAAEACQCIIWRFAILCVPKITDTRPAEIQYKNLRNLKNPVQFSQWQVFDLLFVVTINQPTRQPSLAFSLEVIARVLVLKAIRGGGELVLVLNEGLGGSKWLRGKRKGRASDHRQRKVQICFSRKDSFFFQRLFPFPWFICDVYRTGRRLIGNW